MNSYKVIDNPVLAQRAEVVTGSNRLVQAERACELATVLAALRLWQREYGGMSARSIMECQPEHFTEPGVQPLSDDRIDALCEKLNAGGKL